MLRLIGFLLILADLWKGKPKGAADRGQPSQGAKKKTPGHRYKGRDHPTEEEHRTAEQYNWRRENILAFLTTLFAAGAVVFAFKTFVQTKRQADIAQTALVASTRARLKITAVSNVVLNAAGEHGVVAWFTSIVNYRNYGQSPAENINFTPHIFVVGAGPSPEETCRRDKSSVESFGSSADVVFPQDDGGKWSGGAQVLVSDLKAGAAKVIAIEPTDPIYLGIIGCLVYRSSGTSDARVSGFVGDLHATAAKSDSAKYVSVYQTLLTSQSPVQIEMRINMLEAWVD